MNKSLLAAAILLALSTGANAAAFQAGDLVVYRVGTGTASLSNAATSVYLDEYTKAGALVQSVLMPTSASGSNHMLTASGTATSEGEMTLSTDGKSIVLTGYDAATGTASIASSTSAAVKRTVGVVNVATGTADTSTALNAFSGNNIRSVASTNGTDLWVAGATTGIGYTTLGGSTMTTVSSTITTNRQLEIFGGQLYASDSSGSTNRISTVGTGLPTTSGKTMTNLPGIPASGTSPYSFFMADLSTTVAGMDTLYVADDTVATGGIFKYSLVGGTWVANGKIGSGTDAYRGLTGEVVNGQVDLFATGLGGSGATGGGKLVSITDTTGYNVNYSGTTTTTLATALTNEAMRGVVVIPVPEADSYALILAGMGLVGFLARRRKA